VFSEHQGALKFLAGVITFVCYMMGAFVTLLKKGRNVSFIVFWCSVYILVD